MDVVVQAPHLAPEDVDMLALMTGARGVEPLVRAANDAVRFHEVAHHAGVTEACGAVGYDAAFIAAPRPLADVGVVAMDMDSTLIAIECIDEIADMKGIKPEVAAITERSMRGEIDFAQSLRARVALLAGLPVGDLERVYDERLRLSPGAERMLAGFRAAGATTVLVSGGFTFFTDRLKARLGLDVAVANTLEVVDGQLTGSLTGPLIDAAAKARTVREIVEQRGGVLVTLGDGANDLPMFRAADVSVAYHAKPVVRAEATHAIDHCGLDATLNLFS
ncbi:MAG: phosphoserine phosphatase SerB [Proteobacteria bacterium]|nr:phosphoserine phosphatase SerB [Pseudomonadota bacterium]